MMRISKEISYDEFKRIFIDYLPTEKEDLIQQLYDFFEVWFEDIAEENVIKTLECFREYSEEEIIEGYGEDFQDVFDENGITVFNTCDTQEKNWTYLVMEE